MHFYLTFGFLGFKLVKKRTMNYFKGSGGFGFLSGSTEWYKSALSKSDSSWDNSYCVRLVIVSLAVNVGKLQSLFSEDNFFFYCFHYFYADYRHLLLS